MYRLVYLAYMLMVASAGVTFVFLEDIESDYGISSWGIGLISALSFFTAVIAALAIAPYGDRGHLRTLGYLSFATAIAGNLWIGFATELWSISVSRGLAGLGAGVFSVVGRKALIGTDTDDGGEKIGGFISAAVAGFIAGPAIGAQLSEWGGIETPYLVLAALLLIITVPTLRWLGSIEVATDEHTSISEMIPLLNEPGVRAAVAVQVGLFFNIGVFDATVDEYLTDLGVSNAQVGLILIIIAAPLLVIPRLAGRFVDNAERPARLMLGGFALFVPIVLTLGLWNGVAVFIGFAFAQTALESTLFPTTARVVLNETGAERSAIGTGLVDAAGSLAASVSAFVAPAVYDAAGGARGSFGMSAGVGFALLCYGWWSVRQRDLTKSTVATT